MSINKAPTPKDVFLVITEAVNRALTENFGPPTQGENSRLPALTGAALMQLSLRYFVATGAPIEVVKDIFKQLTEAPAAAPPKLLVDEKEVRDQLMRNALAQRGGRR